ncbi:PIR protein [Plasmodium yoelii]|uniref:YIR protein n=1 Tax=Plasmodium yoelii TaxID=5861 RepID=A0A078KD46_PLAYE|nr:PIR protein [Plasmodium yoelii]CDS44953.1 YIR protein [Plasmodium yoelii]VTZ79758.1 PIR protein [Plasmodium yoelii]|eukprot:XP_022812515.1 PIR protein [Plasmodium yoelii]
MSINNCGEFDTFWKFFRDGLKESKYDFTNGTFKKYCPNNSCVTDTDILNAGCLWLFNAFFGKTGTSHYENTYKDVALCVMIWLSYKLNQKTEHATTKLNDFYSNYIQNNAEYDNHKPNDEKYDSYIKILDEIKEYMDININHMSKFYELFKLLCNMNTAYDNKNSDQISDYANKFVGEYGKLLNDENNIDNSSYSKVLSVLSKSYENFGNYTVLNGTPIKRPPLPTEKTPQKVNLKDPKATETSSGSDKLDTETTALSSNITLSESSLVNKLIPVLSILVAIPIFLGIVYKYSLFGFRKRAQKQHLRKKLTK